MFTIEQCLGWKPVHFNGGDILSGCGGQIFYTWESDEVEKLTAVKQMWYFNAQCGSVSSPWS